MHRVANHSPFVVALLIMSASLNVILSQQLRASRPTVVPSLTIGTSVPAITGRSLDGTSGTITFDDNVPTVLYYFRDDCGWCERNWANVDALVTQTRGRYRVVGIAASELAPAYLKDHPAMLPTITGLDDRTIAAYRFSATPQTVVVAPGGRVIKSWMGAYQGGQADDIAAFFGVTLPGLLSAPTK